MHTKAGEELAWAETVQRPGGEGTHVWGSGEEFGVAQSGRR